MNPLMAFCHRCQKTTATVFLELSSGHIGNCCRICRATRKGKPFVSRTEYEQANAPQGRRVTHASTT
jgi:hypothetical protein